MRMAILCAAGAAALLAGTAAGAAPLHYDCDTAAGSWSQLKQEQAGPDYKVTGSLLAAQVRKDKQWLPTGQIRLISADGARSVGLRMMAEGKGATTFLLLVSRGGDQGETPVARVKLDEKVRFSLSASASEAVVEAGGKSVKLPVAIGAGGSVEATCSTGEFRFEDLELGAR